MSSRDGRLQYTDKRAQKVAVISHCLINQNAKVADYATYAAVVPGLVEILERHRFGIVQMPCPEMQTAGIRRWWQVGDQYRTAGYRKAYGLLADFVLDQIEDYLVAHYTVVVIGVDGSPSCGVAKTETDPSWFGSPTISLKDPQDYYVAGPGAFIELLSRRIEERGLPRIPIFGLPLDVVGAENHLKGLEEFLEAQD